MSTINNINNSERSTVQLLQEINSGILDPKLLDKLNRQRCVELLVMEGYTYQHISQVLKVSEKTVCRDMVEIRARNALNPNIQFAKETIGDLFKHGLNHHAYLMRIARSKDASNSEKIQAEFAAWRVLRELVERMQSLGYLPSHPEHIVGDIFCHMQNEEGGETINEVKRMLLEIETVAKDTDTYSEELAQEIKLLSMRLEKAEVAEETKKLIEKQKEIIKKKEEQNEK